MTKSKEQPTKQESKYKIEKAKVRVTPSVTVNEDGVIEKANLTITEGATETDYSITRRKKK